METNSPPKFFILFFNYTLNKTVTVWKLIKELASDIKG